MPAKSGAQYRLMQAVLHGNVQKEGLDKKTAKEFIDKTPTSKKHRWSKKKKG